MYIVENIVSLFDTDAAIAERFDKPLIPYMCEKHGWSLETYYEYENIYITNTIIN